MVNSFILFQLHRAENPDVEDLKRPQKFSIAEYREELVCQLVDLEEFADPPVFKPPSEDPGSFETAHIVKSSATKRSCKVCYKATQKELKVVTYCSATQCQVYLHCTQEKNCFEVWHSRDYHTKKNDLPVLCFPLLCFVGSKIAKLQDLSNFFLLNLSLTLYRSSLFFSGNVYQVHSEIYRGISHINLEQFTVYCSLYQ